MYISQPTSLTEMYVENDSQENKYKGYLNANFQDYMDSLSLGGSLQVKALKLKQRVAGTFAGIGMAAGALGGPSGIALGFSVGNTVGKYLGNVLGGRLYGQAIADASEINHDSKIRHGQLAATIAFLGQIGGAVDTLRQNENKRKKDDLQAMSA